ncbi:MAG: hypothetical protein ACK5PT_00990, partial [Cereibacter sp.]
RMRSRPRLMARGLSLDPGRHLCAGDALCYSVAVLGSEDGSRADYCRTTQDLVPNVFPKGYQWPWHATRMPDFGSSLGDPAVTREDRACCRVFTDFNRNPAPVPGDLPFSLDRLDADAAI